METETTTTKEELFRVLYFKDGGKSLVSEPMTNAEVWNTRKALGFALTSVIGADYTMQKKRIGRSNRFKWVYAAPGTYGPDGRPIKKAK